MKTPEFETLLKAMNSRQRSALEELEQSHSDIIWDGGQVATRPLRVSVKNNNERSMAAINTREKDAFLRLEFRSRDYKGPHGTFTRHRNFDKAYDLFTYSDINIASDIIRIIKQNYLEERMPVRIKNEVYKNLTKENLSLPINQSKLLNMKYLIISIMGPHAGESESEIFERKINDTEKIGKTFWLMRSRQAKPLMVQSICKEAQSTDNNVFAIFIESSSKGGAMPTSSAHTALSYSSNGKDWDDLPKGLSPVTGKIDSGAYALIFDKLELSNGNIDLWQYADFSKQDFPIKIMQGASTLCAIKKEIATGSGKIKSRFRKIIAVGKLCPPFGVWIR